MKALNELNEAIKKVIEIGNKINDFTTAEIWEKAPLIIHQRLCSELVRIAKKGKKDKKLNEIPEAVKVMDAINVIEKLYPKLQKP